MAGKKVFIVDDEKELLEVIQKKMIQDGYEVATANDGNTALKKLRNYTPDLIIMDIVLPDLDGPEVVRNLQEDPATSKIPVIFLSGIVTDQEEFVSQTEIKVGARKYEALGKPFTYAQLIDKIRRELK